MNKTLFFRCSLWNHSEHYQLKVVWKINKNNKHFFRQKSTVFKFLESTVKLFNTRNYPVKFLVLTMNYWASTHKKCLGSSGCCVLIFYSTHTLCCCHNTSQQLLPVTLAGCYRCQMMQHCNTSQWVQNLLCWWLLSWRGQWSSDLEQRVNEWMMMPVYGGISC